MKTPNIDLGKYDLNKLLRNPMLIHEIQDNLAAIKDGGILGMGIAAGAVKDIDSTLKMVISQYQDNPQLITEIVGKDTLKLIEEFKGITLADDLPVSLFTKHDLSAPDTIIN